MFILQFGLCRAAHTRCAQRDGRGATDECVCTHGFRFILGHDLAQDACEQAHTRQANKQRNGGCDQRRQHEAKRARKDLLHGKPGDRKAGEEGDQHDNHRHFPQTKPGEELTKRTVVGHVACVYIQFKVWQQIVQQPGEGKAHEHANTLDRRNKKHDRKRHGKWQVGCIQHKVDHLC